MNCLGAEKFFVLGCCIGCSFALKLIERAPHRVVAAVLEQPIGLDDANKDELAENLYHRWLKAYLEKNPKADPATAKAFGEKLCSGDFVISVTREFVRHQNAAGGHARRYPGSSAGDRRGDPIFGPERRVHQPVALSLHGHAAGGGYHQTLLQGPRSAMSKRSITALPVVNGKSAGRLVQVGGMLFSSSITGVDLASGTLSGDPAKQIAAAFGNLRGLPDQADAGADELGLVTVCIAEGGNARHVDPAGRLAGPMPGAAGAQDQRMSCRPARWCRSRSSGRAARSGNRSNCLAFRWLPLGVRMDRRLSAPIDGAIRHGPAQRRPPDADAPGVSQWSPSSRGPADRRRI
jgi:hypothetical protein